MIYILTDYKLDNTVLRGPDGANLEVILREWVIDNIGPRPVKGRIHQHHSIAWHQARARLHMPDFIEHLKTLGFDVIIHKELEWHYA